MSSRRGVVCGLPPGHRVAYETTVIIGQSSARKAQGVLRRFRYRVAGLPVGREPSLTATRAQLGRR